MSRLKAVLVAAFIATGGLSTLGCGEEPLTFDQNGVARGTGERVYAYKTGSVQLREDYFHGELIRSRWFKPDGTIVQETNWNKGTGEWIALREDGSIRSRIPFVGGKAEGEGFEYDEQGNVTKIIRYRDGKPVEERSASATTRSVTH